MKRLLVLLIGCGLLLVVSACAKDEPQAQGSFSDGEAKKTTVESADTSDDDQSSSEVMVDGQIFRIMFLNEEVLDYANTVLADSSLLKKEVYTDKVVRPLHEKISEVDAETYFDYYDFLSPNTNIQKLKETAGELMNQEGHITQIIEQAIKDSAHFLKGTDKTIVVMPLNPTDVIAMEKMEGAQGVALSDNLMLLQVHPSFSDEALKYTIAQTYHYTMQMENMAWVSNNLMESFVIEGKAVAFASIVYPDIKMPWTELFTERLKNKVIEELRESENRIDNVTSYEFTGDAARGIPLWSHYKLGNEITQSYLENHPEASIEEWTGRIPTEIILGSEFKELFDEMEGGRE